MESSNSFARRPGSRKAAACFLICVLTVLEPGRSPFHSFTDFGSNQVRRRADRGRGKVSVARRRCRLGVAKKFADHRQAHSGTSGDTGKAVAEVMDAHAVEVSGWAQATPWLLKIDQPCAFLLARDNVWVPRHPWHFPKQLNRGFVEENVLRAGLGIGQPQHPISKINVFPPQAQNFSQPRAGQDQQAYGSDSEGTFSLRLLGLGKCRPEPV